ncbi:MAG TPA: peptidylprolyl isomerase [Pirellulaceae bacterium]|nr:peptidylprolyl isomerase [Pirellulaceae bacterium]HMO90758.1 peptidylprolyl isomerase [Pirellulaceae bacterium]HMP68009.1 peptidylprolyl isomerase [Pirellulaceae bacterium]
MSHRVNPDPRFAFAMFSFVCQFISINLACFIPSTTWSNPPQPDDRFIRDSWIDPKIPDDAVVAQVGVTLLTYREVRNQLGLSIGAKLERLSDEQVARLQAQALEQLAGQQIVVEYLSSIGRGLSSEQVDLEVTQLKRRVETVGKTFEQFLAENNLDLPSLIRNIRWQHSWREFLNDQLTDDNLQKVFKSQGRMLDGTRVRIAQILLRPDNRDLAEDWDSTLQRANEIYASINAETSTWEAAVEQNSVAPSKQNSGDIGWIENDGTMPDTFTEAALALQVGEISQPIKTSIGVHLLKCVDIELGQRTWREVRDELKLLAAKELFTWIVSRHRPKLQVEFTGACPYFDAETNEIVGLSK